MKQVLPYLGSLLLLVIAGAGAVSLTALKNLRPVEIAAGASDEYQEQELPQFERLRQPHAVLVLDVSKSMQTSDPRRLQAAAVEQFYAVYSDLAREIAGWGEPARIAVVLFSTLAQTVDWDGTVWLEATRENSERFSKVVQSWLGSAAADPRTGLDTDYLAALQEVAQLTQGLPSPPVVVFMTDGANEPHGLLTPSLPRAERERLFPSEAARMHGLLDDIEAGRYRYVHAGQPSATLFDRRVFKLGPLPLTGVAVERSRKAITASLAELRSQGFRLSGRYPRVPLFWTPVFLGTGTNATQETDVRELLAGHADEGPWEGKPSFLLCSDPRDLSSQFIGVLGAWLQMTRRDLAPAAGRVQVPVDSQSFAVSLQTESAGTRFELISGDRRVRLVGRDGTWAGVMAGGGDWQFQTDAGAVRRGILFCRPRYEWILHAPSRLAISGKKSDMLRVELYLFSLEREQPVDAAAVYPNLPGELSANASFEPGGSVDFVLARASAGPGPAYVGSLPVAGHAESELEIRVDLSALASHGILVRDRTISQRVVLSPGLRVRVTTVDGKPVSLGAADVPREGESLRRVWRRLHGQRD